MISFSGKAILLDIEGTTSSVSFVYDVLFPFARRHVERFLKEHWQETDVQRACEQIARDAGNVRSDPINRITTNDTEQAQKKVGAEVHRLMDADVKATGLKELQGLIWREGYQSGELRSHVYDDVPPSLQAWNDADLKVCIYSSGSVTAQKLFFAHTEHGDLLPYLHGHYDTTTGPKKESASYTAIAEDMQLPPADILFVSDVVAELDAAAAAGMQTALAVRPGNAPAPEGHGHDVIAAFEEIDIS